MHKSDTVGGLIIGPCWLTWGGYLIMQVTLALAVFWVQLPMFGGYLISPVVVSFGM